MAARDDGPDGVLLLDKPPGITSTRALAKAKRILGSLKGGHTGTLDPFATGLLPLVFGEATKFSRFLLDSRKSYVATLRLGEETPTWDTESDVSARRPVEASLEEIDAALASFLGAQRQTPPMHSAVRIDGRRLYDYARAGEEVDRPTRAIVVEGLARIGREGNDLTLSVDCSKGTYVRTLAQDIGTRLGCGAHLVALRRTGVGGLSLAQAVTFETLEAEGREAAQARLLCPEALVASLPRLDATPEEATRFGHGRVIQRDLGSAGEVAVFGPEGRFLGVGASSGAEGVAPLRLMRTGGAKSPDFA
ncbi:MAG: tRNA pseudouridine(55) synthase TruB [Usitatibacter sp.]